MAQSEPLEILPEPVEVLGLPIRPLTAARLAGCLVERASAGIRTRVCYANAHTANLACRDPAFREVLSRSELLYADGASIVWASRLGRRPLPARLTAADHFPGFARACAAAHLPLYLLGGHPGVAEAAATTLRRDVSGLEIVGTDHGYFAAEDSLAIVKRINAAAPAVLVVGLSSPHQEFWMFRHWDQLRVPVCWCVGALLDYFAGRERRGPSWLCRLGGEWLYRLAMDPRGKWRRYLLGNPRFVFNVIRWRMGRWPRYPAEVASTSNASASASQEENVHAAAR